LYVRNQYLKYYNGAERRVICNWCGEGQGRNYTRDRKTGIVYYYYCQKCVGNFKINPFKIEKINKLIEK